MTGIASCAYPPSGHAAAAPPSIVMNSRRLMGLTPKAKDHVGLSDTYERLNHQNNECGCGEF
jgi:hypothetical protein